MHIVHSNADTSSNNDTA